MALTQSARSGIDPFIVMEVLDTAHRLEADGRDIVHLEIGQPTTPAPEPVRAAARDAIATDRLGYTQALGLPALRSAIAAHYARTYGVTVPEERVVVTTGSSAGFQLAFLAAFDPGARVALAAPGYPAYRNILKALGLVPVEIPATRASRFQPTPAQLADAAPLDGLIVASPANPAGTMLDDAGLADVAAYCQQEGIRLISDEIYHGLTYGHPQATAARSDPSAIVVNSFSKYYAMTGWRVGWLVVPPDLHRGVECLAQNLFISPPAVSQHAALAAFSAEDELEANRRRYARNRDILLAALPEAGFGELAPADGAFYIYADVSALTADSPGFCKAMLHEAGVAATPGVDFDPARGRHYVRFSFAGAEADMHKAAERLRAWLKS